MVRPRNKEEAFIGLVLPHSHWQYHLIFLNLSLGPLDNTVNLPNFCPVKSFGLIILYTPL